MLYSFGVLTKWRNTNDEKLFIRGACRINHKQFCRKVKLYGAREKCRWPTMRTIQTQTQFWNSVV